MLLITTLKFLTKMLALGAIAYLLLAVWRVFVFRERRSGRIVFLPKVTVMVPVHGAPPRLAECLRSICDQNYPDFQVVFGLHSAGDPGRPVIERVIAEHPGRDLTLVIDERRIGANPKVCNLANMHQAVKHDVIVTVDSDVIVDCQFLEMIVEPLADAGVGGVTCLYRAAPAANLPSLLGALYINDWFIPSALVDVGLREIDICYGAAYALSRRSLEATGGFPARADTIAEDDALGELLHKAGFKIKLAPYVVATVVAEPDFRALIRRELRWMRSIRACRPRAHLLAVVMHAMLPTALLTAAAPSWWSLGLLAALVVLRLALHELIAARLPGGTRLASWLVPLRDVLNFGVWAASFLSWSIRWGGQTLRYTGSRKAVTEHGEGS